MKKTYSIFILLIVNLLFSQNNSPEIIVYNNFSNDFTEEIIAKFDDPRITYHKSNKLLTMSESWTSATRLGTGDLLLLLCSDDVIDKHAIETLRKGFLGNSKIVQVMGRRKLRTLNGMIEINQTIFRPKKEVTLINVDVIHKVAMSGSNPFGETLVALFNRPFLETCLPWSSNYPAHIDVDRYLRMSRLGETLLIPEIIGKSAKLPNKKDQKCDPFKNDIILRFQSK
jgi:glycosyltransferase involved in cell wall biosynthesis